MVGGVTTLFVDFIPHECSTGELKSIFQQAGFVDDIYISKKIRKSIKLAFGFVRFKSSKEAKRAIAILNGVSVKQSKIKVSMAKYDRNGQAFNRRPVTFKHPANFRRFINPALRDSRNYNTKVQNRRPNRFRNVTKHAFRETRTYKEVGLGKKRTDLASEHEANSIQEYGGGTHPTKINPPEQDAECGYSEKTLGDESSMSTQASEAMDVGDDDRKEGETIVEDLENGRQDVDGEDGQMDSMSLKLSQVPGSIHPKNVEKTQEIGELTPHKSGGVGVLNEQTTVSFKNQRPCKLVRLHKPWDVAKFLGYYGPITENVS